MFNLDSLGLFDGKTGPIFMAVCGKVETWLRETWNLSLWMPSRALQYSVQGVSGVFSRVFTEVNVSSSENIKAGSKDSVRQSLDRLEKAMGGFGLAEMLHMRWPCCR